MPCIASEPKASCDSSVDAVAWFRRASVVGKLAWFSRDRAALAGWIGAVWSKLTLCLLPLPKMSDGAVPTPQAGSMLDGLSNIALGTGDGGIHGQTTCHESRYSSREGAAGAMCMACRNTLRTQFSKAFPIEVHIYRISSAMASLHHDMAGTQGTNGLGRCTHIIQRLNPLSGQYFGLEQIGRDHLSQRQEYSRERSDRFRLKQRVSTFGYHHRVHHQAQVPSRDTPGNHFDDGRTGEHSCLGSISPDIFKYSINLCLDQLWWEVLGSKHSLSILCCDGGQR